MPQKLIVTGTLLLLLTVTLGLTRNPSAVAPTQASGGSSTVSSGRASSATGRMTASTRSIGGSLRWQITSSSTAQRIENDYLPALVAHGVFLMLQVVADNGSATPIDLDGDSVALSLDGTRYQLDQPALASLELEGHSALTPIELKPGTTASGWVVFDVPPSAVAATPHLCVPPGMQGAVASATACG